MVLAPWTVRNWIVFDRPVLVATEAGETLAAANCAPVYEGERIGSSEIACAELSGVRNEAAELNEAGRKGIRYALDHVDRWPAVALARLARTWSVYPRFQRPEGRSEWVVKLGLGVFFLLLPLAAYGFVLSGAGARRSGS